MEKPMSRKFLIAVSIAALAACNRPAEMPAEPTAEAAQPSVSPNDATAGEYKLDPTHASIVWKVPHMGLSNYTARFTKFDATLNFDPKDPAKNRVDVTIDPTSIRTDYPYNDIKSPFGVTENFDQTLATGENWFEATKFPKITFKSTGVEQTGDNSARVTGDLTLKGVTKPVVMDVTFNGSYAKHPMAPIAVVGFSGVTTIKRSDFGMTYAAPQIGDDVQIMVEAEFSRPVDEAVVAPSGSE
jgi:polyisoprenoid-binding protein YceI